MQTKELVDLLKQESYWKSLLPTFSITPTVFNNGHNDFSYDETILNNAANNLNEEGYFKLDSVLPDSLTSSLTQGIRTLTSSGILPVFSMVYDEYWHVLRGLKTILSKTLGEDWVVLPDIWGWNVEKGHNNSGWTAHRDLNDHYVDDNGHPGFLTLWITLTDATPLNSCIYILPTHLDPFYPDHLREFPSKPENFANVSFENIRALPAKQGSVLCWDVNAVHWGSRSTKHAEDARISIAFYLKRGSKISDTTINFDNDFLFEERLKLIAENLFRYKKRNKYTPLLIEFAKSFADYDKEWDWEP